MLDAILEKGCRTRCYLSDDTDGNVRKAAEELRRVLKPGGIFAVSQVYAAAGRIYDVAYVAPVHHWIRDGTAHLKAVALWRAPTTVPYTSSARTGGHRHKTCAPVVAADRAVYF